ncbi:hypothetical protein [Conchiformibius steedae]|uniref:Uncharacterized protein n=1 Tax=Conchiformibius steedae TaxID=153493 RepID=A0A3P2A1W2_9NEIS|nr:hypothetical protein [Conchiformibius steedae]RRD88988.1 hypothetical protein EII21_10420 [Conchiformibius steedae]
MPETPNASTEPPDSYAAYTILHIFSGLPLTALLSAGALDAIMWVHSGHYQNIVYWLLATTRWTWILWILVSLIFGGLMSLFAFLFGWKRNRTGTVASVLLSGILYTIPLTIIYFLIYIILNIGHNTTSEEMSRVIILHALLFGICGGVVGGLFAQVLPREVSDTAHVSTHKAATKQPEN